MTLIQQGPRGDSFKYIDDLSDISPFLKGLTVGFKFIYWKITQPINVISFRC